jgi:hypothetical protein
MTSHDDKQSGERIEALAEILRAMPGTSSICQRNRILTAMQQLGNVTSYEASRYLDCYYPPARVYELRKAEHRIKTVMRGERTESGVMHHVGVYLLEGGNHV